MARRKSKKRPEPEKEKEEFAGDKGERKSKGKGRKPTDAKGNHAYSSNGHNDPSWYTKSGVLSTYAGKLSWAYPTGSALQVSPPSRTDNRNVTDGSDRRVNGILSLDIAIVPGCDTINPSIYAGNPCNMAARDIYAFLRSTNSGAKNYEPADIITYILAMDSIFSMYAWGMRAIGTVALSSAFNLYYPRALVEAQGFDYDTMRNNLSNFILRMNLVASRMSKFKVPLGLSIIDRHFMLFSNVYMDDGTDVRSQLYLYRPVVFWEYDGLDAGISLKPIWVDEIDPQNADFLDFDLYLTQLEEMVHVFTTMADTPIMNGDMIKAYGNAGTYTLPPIPNGYVTIPGYNESVLYQMRNAILAGEPAKDDGWHISQSGGLLSFDPGFEATKWEDVSYYFKGTQLISSPHPLPTDEEVLVYSRLMTTFYKSGNETTPNRVRANSLGSDVATIGRVWTLTDELKGGFYKFGGVAAQSGRYNGNGATSTKLLSALSNFKHHPRIALMGNVFTYEGEFWEYDSYAQPTEEQLNNMNYVALLSLFAIPEVGAWGGGTK